MTTNILLGLAVIYYVVALYGTNHKRSPTGALWCWLMIVVGVTLLVVRASK